jgi:mono/diheme cytochrome c family protein
MSEPSVSMIRRALLLTLLFTACKSAGDAPSAGPAASSVDDALGGRLFDRWALDETFVADDEKTPGVADGRGGPFGDGTLPGPGGAPVLNAGHGYRLKNVFGWDLRGASGIYGPAAQNKPFVSKRDLLAGTESEDALFEELSKGSADVFALSPVLKEHELRAIARFVHRVRSGELPRPEQIWTLKPGSKGHYVLNDGADPARGKKLFEDRCVECHGELGIDEPIAGGAHSVGTISRQSAYEIWIKLLNGQPGTDMKRQVKGASAQEMAQEILDLLAAFCDRTAFPKGTATSDDVADGDPRCGVYLR